MKEQMYQKEILYTLGFSLLFILLGHSASIFVLFPSLQGGWMWGFPVHYIVPLLLGWFGLTIASTIMALIFNKFDDDMEAIVKNDAIKSKPTSSPALSMSKGE